MDIAKRITDLKNAKGYTTNKLANMAGISQGFVRQVELGEKQPTVSTIEKICDALDITLIDFFQVDSEIRTVVQELVNTVNDLPDDKVQALITAAKAMK